MIPVAVYCRVSTDRDDQLNSFAAQQRYFRQYIEEHPDWQLYEIYADEGITGTSTRRRAQFNRMIRDAYAGRFRLILTKEVSRFSRNILDTIRYTRQLKELGIGVLFATDRISTLAPEAEMLLSFLATLAQEESRRTSSRVVWGQTRQMERGVVFGRSLLGYKVQGGKITPEPEGAETVRLIFQKYALEQCSAGQIAAFLQKEQYRTGGGSRDWNANKVLKILRNEKYVGDLVQKKTYTPDYLTHAKKPNRGEVPLITIRNHHEPLISRELWDLAQQQLRKNRKQNAVGTGHSNRYAFSGRIRCAECGAAFVGKWKYGKDGSKLRRWSCGTAARKGAVSCAVGKLVRDDDAMQMLKTAIRNLSLDTEDLIGTVTDLALEAMLEDSCSVSGQNRLNRELDCIRKKKENLMDSYFSRDIAKEEMLAMKQIYDNRIQTLLERQKAAEEAFRKQNILRSEIRSEISGILAGEKESAVFCKTILESLTVYKDRHMELRLKDLPHVFRFR